MEGPAILLYLAINVPLSLGLLLLVWFSDRYEREPLWAVLLSACWGALPAVFLSCLLESAAGPALTALLGPREGAFLSAVLLAPPVEEAAKATALVLVVLLYAREFDDVLDGLVYGAAVGVGFSFVEDFVYFAGAVHEGGAGLGAVVFAMRNLGFMLNHSLFTALTGIGFGLARVNARNPLALLFFPPMGFAAAVGLHTLHNFFSSLAAPGVVLALAIHWAGGLGLAGLIPLLWAVERRWILTRLKSEVAEGRIPRTALACLPFSGLSGRSFPPRAASALRRDLVELAFGRRRKEEGWGGDGEGALDALRVRIGRLCGEPATKAAPAPPGFPPDPPGTGPGAGRPPA